VIEEELTKLKWSREEEATRPWAIGDLSRPPTEQRQGFYPLADFALPQGIFAGFFTTDRKVESLGSSPSWVPFLLLSYVFCGLVVVTAR
jgi:hypothetical protein